MRIYTRRGDGGRTDLQGGTRVAKSHLRIAAYGAADEANCAVGAAIAAGPGAEIRDALDAVQRDLFVAGADLSNPDMADPSCRVTPGMVESLESAIDEMDGQLPPLASFVLPGGCEAAARLHQARAATRRAEAAAVRLAESGDVNPECIRYLNRLSDLLFVAARLANKMDGRGDAPWRP
ncbi:MAG: cob(I)yrinic acid a,c-diamide adenosyltransferase [Nitrosopumilus sp.]|nr:cob(I)yrinic acid a,c-diamide adenosyltransferase [Nitrosopumilus sp.]MDA7944324.1 cob(I)yrinic acid a,c-diamide adenosyltransferase [Nitrosopumilus sp.]MDA7954076.1 cob(I)yrinic acid a,c-diamide adenosyltransferase [Nitrosopumilus sp.]MDA7973004.1 cob(I)yrinic acid a,c-diamide adenosyltransferase [Nitrosopumilus sp.]MDA7997680.1 cob(I)yrinic acid a,c-diamide adenosyltransferase [Nitrosopumilus sp.]